MLVLGKKIEMFVEIFIGKDYWDRFKVANNRFFKGLRFVAVLFVYLISQAPYSHRSKDSEINIYVTLNGLVSGSSGHFANNICGKFYFESFFRNAVSFFDMHVLFCI